MKSLILFLQLLIEDFGEWCCTSTAFDLSTIESRVKHEGLSFMTITLPDFGKDFEKSLEQGKVADDQFLSFRKGKGGLPLFLGGFLQLVFDRETCVLLDDPNLVAIFAIRQICLLYGKILMKCAPKRINKAKLAYIECESELRLSDSKLSSDDFEDFLRIGRLLWSDVFQSIDENIYYGNIIPRHGPGQTAEKLSSNAKWYQSEWTDRLERVFPHMEMLASSWSLSLDRLSGIVFREPGTERPVRVVTVPKTLKTPRIIAIEPACMMYVQQAILRQFEEKLLGDRLLNSFIGWKSQEPNQLMALEGSRNGSLATLDLSEASDRVSNQLVRGLLRNFPNLLEGVDACRSRKADVDGNVLRLAKFASMGSALCFPFESIVFLTLMFLGIEKELNTKLTKTLVEGYLGRVRVYGDDLVVPVEFVHSVIGRLEAFGFRVNTGKSFWTGKFRESCGKEYYDGHDVSITRVRTKFPSSRKHVSEILSTISTRNQLYKAGLWKSAAFLDDIIERLVPFPVVEESSPLKGRFSYLGVDYPGRLDPALHYPLSKGIIVSTMLPKDHLDDYGALLKCLISLNTREANNLPVVGVKHLERAGRARTVNIKTSWGPRY